MKYKTIRKNLEIKNFKDGATTEKTRIFMYVSMYNALFLNIIVFAAKVLTKGRER